MMPGKVCILVFNYSVHNQFLTLMNTINLCWSDLRTVLYMYMIQSGRKLMLHIYVLSIQENLCGSFT